MKNFSSILILSISFLLISSCSISPFKAPEMSVDTQNVILPSGCIVTPSSLTYQDVTYSISGTLDVPYCNGHIDTETLMDWCYITCYEDGYGYFTIKFYAEPNVSTEPRTGEVVLTFKDQELRLSVTQEGIPDFKPSSDTVYIASTGGTALVTLPTVANDVEVGASWLGISKGENSEYYISASSNTSKNDRLAVVRFSYYGEIVLQVVVLQEGMVDGSGFEDYSGIYAYYYTMDGQQYSWSFKFTRSNENSSLYYVSAFGNAEREYTAQVDENGRLVVGMDSYAFDGHDNIMRAYHYKDGTNDVYVWTDENVIFQFTSSYMTFVNGLALGYFESETTFMTYLSAMPGEYAQKQ